jgi:hypothetical protein
MCGSDCTLRSCEHSADRPSYQVRLPPQIFPTWSAASNRFLSRQLAQWLARVAAMLTCEHAVGFLQNNDQRSTGVNATTVTFTECSRDGDSEPRHDLPSDEASTTMHAMRGAYGMDTDGAPCTTLKTDGRATRLPASTDTCTRDVATPRTPPCGSISLLAAALARTPVKACRIARSMESIKVKHRQSKKTLLRPSTLYALSRHHMTLLAMFQSCC